MYLSVYECPGPRWHKKHRTNDGNASSSSNESSDSGNVLHASRFWDRTESKKTSGCMAD